ncbi:MAG TPA: nuclear transport factor 2 family protein [Baekduia sp.]|nr:nuclear transport factor 2 family protein [Baekduia sp.]
MDDPTVQRFLTALRDHESGGDPEPLVSLFREDAQIDTATGAHDLRGRDGARRLWAEDRERFGAVRSAFRNVVVQDDRAALEWTREVPARDGATVAVQGVSVLELEDGAIRRFSTYFDPQLLTGATA